eukprot:TRINITY_DN3694_c0_g1_i10.p1 TRINITY_DN3694_c0_g1~~TRINITY_DN3694_c0_g1_i10.p1  ORF type:complete len:336 (-),score=95.08 TRINITY_DN3694_c0_g1_i10:136-1143(-)
MELEGGIHTNTKGTVEQYFKYYSKLSNQQNMMQDSIRTSYYHDAILKNKADFKDKVVMDVGAGSGILSLFAAKAGAKKVIAVEASSAARSAKILIESNGLSHIIQIMEVCVEDINDKELEKSVDVIVSEPLGTILFNERMLESYVIARDKFLKPGGKMYPSEAFLCVAPFYDERLYNEQLNKTIFWNNISFYGINLNALKNQAVAEKFRQPIIESYDPQTNLAADVRYKVDFLTCKLIDLQHINFDFSFDISRVGIIHGVGVWFNACFSGSETTLVLSTSPFSPPTHWYQTRFLLLQPIAVNPGQSVKGNITMNANEEQTLDVKVTLTLPELNVC